MAQERSERTRGRLVEAGAVLFDRSGYAGATLGEIASTAGVTKGALYFHFASKEVLARAVLEQAERSLRGACATLRTASSPLQALIDSGYWLVDALGSDAVIRAGFRLGREGGAWLGETAAEGRAAGACAAGAQGFHGVWAGVVRELLSGAHRAGELRDRPGGTGPESLVVTAACGLEVTFGECCSSEERARRVAALWEWLLPCLVPPGASALYRTRPLTGVPAWSGHE
ncbi:ScbR family autoregulator-binding transcription factor [Streptomyces sp. SP17BM10]|uniref:ScbR family autoregulator-binding transcription factor n=1 Tax=Streptomyces sp. SP17BM10 TaxID=3002530 RepID=UPI002E7860A3|nr:ScbR family autoregulator-binding transcription factor [Streptomyces sp. SP17BM10]MEE1782648.1 ScbR family autoregulator-binding transcription factor [Streptomyces sp. SP17BM10]